MSRRVPTHLAIAFLVSLCTGCVPNPAADVRAGRGVTIIATWRGASAEEMLKSVAIPLEHELRGIKSVNRIITRCDRETCTIFLQHSPGVSSDEITFLAGTAIRRAQRSLPEDARAVARPLDVRRPPDIVIAVVVDTDQPEAVRGKTVRTFAARIMQLPSAVRYEIVGSPEERIEVVVDTKRAAAYGITPGEVERAVRERILAVDEYTTVIIRSGGRKPGTEVGDIQLRKVGKTAIRVRDIATIKRTLTPGSLHRVDGQPAAIVNVYLRSEASPAEIAACFDRLLKVARPRSVRRVVAISVRTD